MPGDEYDVHLPSTGEAHRGSFTPSASQAYRSRVIAHVLSPARASHCVAMYLDIPTVFTSLLPAPDVLARLLHRAKPVVVASLQLQGVLTPGARELVREQVRLRNAVYASRLDGRDVVPVDVLLPQYDVGHVYTAVRDARAYVEADRQLAALNLSIAQACHSHTWLHAHALLQHAAQNTVADRAAPGGQVAIPSLASLGMPPEQVDAVQRFLHQADEVLAREHGFEMRLVAAACVYFRYRALQAWVPNNGPACRLHLQAILRPLSADLWSVQRGLLQHRDRWEALLAHAEAQALDTMTPHSSSVQQALAQWCEAFIDLCQEQVDAMSAQLEPQSLEDRLKACLQQLAQTSIAARSVYPKTLAIPMLHLMVFGPIPRAVFARMTGMKGPEVDQAVTQLLQDGLLLGEHGADRLRFGLTLEAAEQLLPDL